MSQATCPSDHELLDLLAGSLPEERRGALRLHLSGCARCCEMLAALDSDVGGSAAPPPPPARDGAAALSLYGLGFPGMERFELRRCLGIGSFGAVFEVLDRKREAIVALKVVKETNAAALYRFKQEFRSLNRLVHHNLITLYELLTDGQNWCFTMELIEGRELLDYLDSERGEPALLTALRQICDGLLFLHRAGKLHRDLKPQNILVTNDGRLYLLDFGMVLDITPELGAQNSDTIAGTPLYMSPEQATGQPLSPASDWYSVGVILYKALTGEFPFVRLTPLELSNRRSAAPPRPALRNPAVSPELDQLCVDLLQPDPSLRPGGKEVYARLLALGGGAEAPVPEVQATPWEDAPFFGRARLLERLAEAAARAQQGQATFVLCEGSSGMGKSALVRHFLRQLLDANPAAIVLSGRCHEYEEIPFKALDGVIDGVARLLTQRSGGRLAPVEIESLLPRDIHALAKLFPVFQQVTAALRSTARPISNPKSERKAAAAALRELLVRLCEHHAVVLWMDDLQWGDLDSVALLSDLLLPPQPPPLLVIACARGEEAESAPALLSLREALEGQLALSVATQFVKVAEFELEAAMALAGSLLQGATAEQVRVVAKESCGSPLFLAELIRQRNERTASSAPPADSSLDSMIQQRVQRLPESAQRLLQVVAIAGRPLQRTLARKVAWAGCGSTDEPQSLALLRGGNLLRVRQSRGEDALEVYHDRVREALTTKLSPQVKRAQHRALVEALEQSGDGEPEQLVYHCQEAGDPIRATRYAIEAAERAHRTLAFVQAARLYEKVLSLGAIDEAAARHLWSRRAEALASAGRPLASAQAYLEAAQRESPSRALILRREAAEQLLRSGHVAQGLAQLINVLRAVGLSLAPTKLQALLGLLWLRLLLGLRGHRFHERDEQQVPARSLLQIDTCWSAAMGLGLVQQDPLHAFSFQTRNLLLSLRAGEPYRISRALALEAYYSALAGMRSRRRTEDLLARATALAQRASRPHAMGLCRMVSGFAAYSCGQWRRSAAVLREAEAVLRDSCVGLSWELDTTRVQLASCLWWQGELRELAALVGPLVQDAQDRQSLYCEIMLRIASAALLHLAADQPEQARETVRTAIASWGQRHFDIQHFAAMVVEVVICGYVGDPDPWSLIEDRWPALRGSGLLGAQFIRIQSRVARGAAALAGPGARLRIAEAEADRLAQERVAWAQCMSLTLRAAIARRHGEGVAEGLLLQQAEAGFHAADMALFAACVRRRRGERLGGREGEALIAAADAELSARGVVAPARMTAALIPP